MQENTHARGLKTRAVLIFAALGLVAIDTLFKIIALERFPTPTSAPPDRLVAFGLHKNPGIIFDIPIPPPLLWVLTLMLLAFLTRFAWNARETNSVASLGAIVTIIGALGNFIDRVLNGFTTDYLIFMTRSAINLSDLVIVGGILLMVFPRAKLGKAISVHMRGVDKIEKV